MANAHISEIAARTPNFGYLLSHEPLLVIYGAEAETYLYTSPNTSMMKARQFGEALVAALMAEFDIKIKSDKQSARLKVLLDQGVVPSRVHGWFDAVRLKGNKATHEGNAAQRDALLLVRACYELGGWFHRLVTGNTDSPPFVPPQPPSAQPEPTSVADAEALAELRQQLAAYNTELIEMKTQLHAQQSIAAAQAQAQQQANGEILRAVHGHDDLAQLVQQLSSQVDALQRKLEDRATAPTARNAVSRDELVERAQRASQPPMSEAEVRRTIDRLLVAAGWKVQDEADQNLLAATGVAVREVPTVVGRADYLLYVTGKLVGIIEAKREGVSLAGVEQQSARYATGLTAGQQLTAWRTPLPFRYESAGTETHFTNGLDPVPRARRVFAFHQPRTVARWMRGADAQPDAPTLRARLRQMPTLATEGLRDAQVEAITGLEQSLAADRPRALVQMATGAGKTYTVVTESYRWLKYAGAKRVLFLVDRNNLGRQAKAEYDRYVTAEEHSGFTELYNVQRLTSGVVLDSANVVVSTVQRLYSMLRGEPIPADVDDPDFEDYDIGEAVDLEYSPDIPPETFDLVVVDECHRSIYTLRRSGSQPVRMPTAGANTSRNATPCPRR